MNYLKVITLFFSISFSFLQIVQGMDKIDVAVKHSPPFLYVEEDSVYGINYELFRSLAESLNVRYRFVYCQSVDAVVDSIVSGHAEMSIAPLSVTSSRYEKMQFTQPIFIGGLSVAEKQHPSGLFQLLKQVFSFDFFYALFILLCVISLFGIVLWLVERRHNPDDFGTGLAGLVDGIWWSAVTMTTVGYGDKSPKTYLGRLIGIVWMFTAVISISSFTAGIASSLTTNNLRSTVSEIDDLRDKNVGTVAGSSSSQLLSDNFIRHSSFKSVPDLLGALSAGDIEYALYDQAILKYYASDEFSGINVQDHILYPQYYSFALSSSMNDVVDINIAVMKALESREWSHAKQQLQ